MKKAISLVVVLTVLIGVFLMAQVPSGESSAQRENSATAFVQLLAKGDFAGALQGQRARKGIFITTSNFTKDALENVNNIESKIILIDGQRLAELMIEHNVGVSPVASYDVKKIDTDYFIED